MKPERPLLWHQGLFLQPQHFQRLDVYTNALLAPFREFGRNYFYGVAGVELSADELANQTVRFTSVDVLFQDGTRVSSPENAIVQTRRLAQGAVEPGRAFRVFLGLRRWNDAGSNVVVTELPEQAMASGKRLVASERTEQVADSHGDGPASDVHFMRYIVRLFWEPECAALGDYLLLPIARLHYDGEKLVEMRDYIPPLLSVHSSTALMGIIQSIREQVLARGRQLEDYKQPQEARSGEIDVGSMRRRRALQTVNRAIARLFHLTAAPSVHPFDVYGALREIVGELSTFTERINALGISDQGSELLGDYAHEQLAECFTRAQQLIGRMLAMIVVGPENVIPLERHESSFAAAVPLNAFDPRNRYFLAVTTSEQPERLEHALREIAKLSSTEGIAVLLSRALPGIPLSHCAVPPPGMPRRGDVHYFSIDTAHEQWMEVQRGQSICLFWDQAPPDTRISLVVLRRS